MPVDLPNGSRPFLTSPTRRQYDSEPFSANCFSRERLKSSGKSRGSKTFDRGFAEVCISLALRGKSVTMICAVFRIVTVFVRHKLVVGEFQAFRTEKIGFLINSLCESSENSSTHIACGSDVTECPRVSRAALTTRHRVGASFRDNRFVGTQCAGSSKKTYNSDVILSRFEKGICNPREPSE